MKNAIFQYFLNYNGVGKNHRHYPTHGIPDWAIYSTNYFAKYANTHNCDYYLMSDRYVNSSSNYFEALRVYLDPIFDQYENILYVDVDVMPKNMNENIFSIDVVDIAGWPEWQHPKITGKINWSKSNSIIDRFRHFQSPLKSSNTTNAPFRMINTGVVIWSKNARLKARNNFINHESWFSYKNVLLDQRLDSSKVGHSSHCLDQPFLNAMWNRFDFDVLELDYTWNRFPTKKEDEFCNFAHYVGNSRYDIPKIYKDIKK